MVNFNSAAGTGRVQREIPVEGADGRVEYIYISSQCEFVSFGCFYPPLLPFPYIIDHSIGFDKKRCGVIV